MFGSNSPGCPERAADLRVRLAHPFFPNSIVNQHLQALRRVQRQPLTVLSDHRIVKTSLRFLDDFFTRRPDQKHSAKSPARLSRSTPLASPPTASTAASFKAGPNCTQFRLYPQASTPQRDNFLHQYETVLGASRPTQPPPNKKSPVHVLTGPNRYSERLQLPISPAILPNGPCRNRTYNLAIKSRLLCQLS